MKIKSATVSFNEQGHLFATEFDDIYFSKLNGIAETEYVFIEGNRLADLWSNCTESSFCIAETGFGSGLNFFITVAKFINFKANNPTAKLQHLHYISTEKYPLTIIDIVKLMAQFPQFSNDVEALTRQYPLNLEGCHRLVFANGIVNLDLWLDDASKAFNQMAVGKEGLVDAWFLDGFSPSKNRSMWSDKLFNAMARLSKTKASFATFTAAGIVKRGLQNAGFDVVKQKGFAHKRHMLVGHYRGGELTTPSRVGQSSYFHRMNLPATPKHIGIVGGGIAAAIMALKLVEKGIKVTLLCKDSGLAMGASGNDVGGFYPQLNADAGINSQIHAHSFLYARRFYESLNEQHAFSHNWCGVIQLAFNEKVTQRHHNMSKNACWPYELIHPIDADMVNNISKVGINASGLFIPLGGWVSPPSLVAACIQRAQDIGEMTLKLNCNVFHLNSLDGEQGISIRAITNEHEETYHFDALVIATGAQTSGLLKQQGAEIHIPFRLTRGQVESVPATQESSHLATVLCHKGYMTPSVHGVHAMGSTYVKDDLNTDYRSEEREMNKAMHINALLNSTFDLPVNQDFNGRAAIRCSTPDHLPVVGLFPHLDKQAQLYADLYKAKPANTYPIDTEDTRIFLLSGLGSRGLTTAPLCAELLVSQMLGLPLPLGNQLANALNPNRFLIRDLIRRK